MEECWEGELHDVAGPSNHQVDGGGAQLPQVSSISKELPESLWDACLLGEGAPPQHCVEGRGPLEQGGDAEAQGWVEGLG